MSTRSTTHFNDQYGNHAIVYRHADGYPEGAGQDIYRFLAECEKLNDSRFYDPAYLAAKYVVFLADMFNHEFKSIDGEFKEVRHSSRLEFRSVGVVMEDPCDIEFRYVIECADRPTVKCYAVKDGFSDDRETRYELVESFTPDPDTGWTL